MTPEQIAEQAAEKFNKERPLFKQIQKAVIGAFETNESFFEKFYKWNGLIETLEAVCAAYCKQQEQDRWIPIVEGGDFPKNEAVWAMLNYDIVACVYFSTILNKWCWVYSTEPIDYDVTAYQPKPQPYQPKTVDNG